jgi:hypothetical protein
MAKRSIEVRTALDINTVRRLFREALEGVSRKVEFGAVSGSDNPFDDVEDFSGYGSLSTFTGGWVVQIYIFDHGDARIVHLVPVGSSALGRAFHGLKNTYSFASSQEKAAVVVEALRAADPALTATG